MDYKKWLFESHEEKLGPIYERRVHYDENKREVVDILHDGANRARKGTLKNNFSEWAPRFASDSVATD